MAKLTCPDCNRTIDNEEAQYCPVCGANLYESVTPWVCKACGQENEPQAMFCIGCGQSKEKQIEKARTFTGKISYFFQSKVFKYGILLLLIMLLGGGGSYYYFNNMNEGKYLSRYASAANTIEDVNAVVVSHIKEDVLSQSKPEEIRDQLKGKQDDLEKHAQEFAEKKAFQNYEKQHADVTSLLQKESILIDQILQVTDNPLDEKTEAEIEEIKENIDTIKTLSSSIQVPSANFTSSTDLSQIPQQLSSFVNAKKKANQEKTDRLAANQGFFRQMDEAIQQYNSAKEDLGSMKESSRKGMMWADYFNILDRARSSRIAVKNKVDPINAPAGTVQLKQQYLSVLNKSIRYCELLRMAANLEYNHHYTEANQKEEEAKAVDKQVQSEYAAFSERYDGAKNRLTNVNNL